MKACSGFILRNLAGENVLMPVGDNIRAFGGAVLLNELSAFVWEQLQAFVTREQLLTGILNRYDIDEKTAAEDLDALLATLKKMGLIEE